jgi:uncharacterized protein YuzE
LSRYISRIEIDIIKEVGVLKIKYSNEVDILLIEFKEGTPVDSIDIKEGIILHLNSEGVPIEMEILDASKVVSMEEFNIMIPGKRDKDLAAQA